MLSRPEAEVTQLPGFGWTTEDDAAATLTVERNRRLFHHLLDVAQRRYCARDHAGSAAYALAAAECAWLNPNGTFADLALESLLARISEHLPNVRSSPSHDAARVLHVLTEAHATGGHTRYLARWLASDPDHSHTVVITRQGGLPIPELLRTAVEKTGAHLVVLDRGEYGLLQHAASLRHVVAQHGVVVLHAHPSDVVPMLALAAMTPRPLVATLNHADHVFWLGVSISDAVICFRPCSEHLSVTRRGVEPHRLLSLPIPIAAPLTTATTRGRIRDELSIPESAVVALSVAAAYKYASPYGGPAFPTVLTTACQAIPDLHVLIVGPHPNGDWSRAESITHGRLRALGVRTDLDDLFAAADLYVDSFPCGSGTSTLEAAAAGLPVFAMPVWRRHFPLATEHSAALTPLVSAAATPEDLVELLHDAAQDQAATRALGENLRVTVLGNHSGKGWRAHLNAFYSALETLPSGPPEPRDVPQTTSQPEDLILSHLVSAGALRAGQLGNLGSAISFLPIMKRLGSSLHYVRSGGRDRYYLAYSLLSHRALCMRRRLRASVRGRLLISVAGRSSRHGNQTR